VRNPLSAGYNPERLDRELRFPRSAPDVWRPPLFVECGSLGAVFLCGLYG